MPYSRNLDDLYNRLLQEQLAEAKSSRQDRCIYTLVQDMIDTQCGRIHVASFDICQSFVFCPYCGKRVIIISEE